MPFIALRPVRRSDGAELVQANLDSRGHHGPWMQPFTTLDGFQDAQGDWKGIQDLVQNGADASTFMLGILATPGVNYDYNLYTYGWAEDPAADSKDRSTWAPAYGPTVDLQLTPCR